MRDWLRRRLPTEEKLQANPSLRWLGPLLRRPWLWQLNRRRVALGAGIGGFFGFLIPVAQILGAAALAILLRANLPVAALATLVSNPLTYAPIFVLAYRTGASLLGEKVQPGDARALADELAEDIADAPPLPTVDQPRWRDRLRAVGRPLFLGLAVFAVTGGFATWAVVHVAWTLGVWLRRRRRLRARRGA